MTNHIEIKHTNKEVNTNNEIQNKSKSKVEMCCVMIC